MEWFVLARLICQICRRLRLRCKDVYIYSHAFFATFRCSFWVGDIINRCGFMPMSSLFRIIHQEFPRRTTVVLQAPEYIGGRQL